MKPKQKIIPVSVLKNNLLEIVREVQKGKGFRISKGGQVVAALTPASDEEIVDFGFARAIVNGALTLTEEEAPWGFDSENLK